MLRFRSFQTCSAAALAFLLSAGVCAGALIPPGVALDGGDLRTSADQLQNELASSKNNVYEIYSANNDFWSAFMRTRQQQAPDTIGRIHRPEQLVGKDEPVTEKAFLDGMRRELDAREVPAPASIAKADFWDAQAVGERLYSDGGLGQDKDGELPKGAIGAFMWDPLGRSRDRVLLGKPLYHRILAEYALLTPVHELTHALWKIRGMLDPKEEKKGEIGAFTAEYWFAKMIDPDGEKLAALTQMVNVDPDVDPGTRSFIHHIDDLMAAGDQGRIPEFVDSLGYEDGPASGKPHGDGKQHS